jgi:hypothetical protein
VRPEITTQRLLLPADYSRFIDAIDAALRWTDWSLPSPMEVGWQDKTSREQ